VEATGRFGSEDLSRSNAREKIVDAACELFHQRGYRAVGVQEICDSAGVQKGSFYHFFRSKQELALAMLDQTWLRMQELKFTPAFRDELPPLQRIERYLEILPQVFGELRMSQGAVCGCPFGNMALEMSTHDDAIRRKLDSIYRAWARYLEDCLDEAIECGDLPAIDTRTAADSVVAYISGMAVLAKTRNSLDATASLRPAVLALIHPTLLERLGPPRPQPAPSASPPAG